jgi:hypothetical protein
VKRCSGQEDGRDAQWVLYSEEGEMVSCAEGQDGRRDLCGVEAQNENGERELASRATSGN